MHFAPFTVIGPTHRFVASVTRYVELLVVLGDMNQGSPTVNFAFPADASAIRHQHLCHQVVPRVQPGDMMSGRRFHHRLAPSELIQLGPYNTYLLLVLLLGRTVLNWADVL